MQGEPLETDDDGLYKPPKSPLALIGPYTAPPMLDLSAGALSVAIQQAKQEQSDANQKIAELRAQKFQLQNMVSQCSMSVTPSQGVSASLQVANQASQALRNANCLNGFNSGGKNSCKQKQLELMQLMGGIAEINMGEVQQVADLHTGIASMCHPTEVGNISNDETAQMGCEVAYEGVKSALTAVGHASKNAGNAGSANAGGRRTTQCK
jgi:hypothetical protein